MFRRGHDPFNERVFPLEAAHERIAHPSRRGGGPRRTSPRSGPAADRGTAVRARGTGPGGRRSRASRCARQRHASTSAGPTCCETDRLGEHGGATGHRARHTPPRERSPVFRAATRRQVALYRVGHRAASADTTLLAPETRVTWPSPCSISAGAPADEATSPQRVGTPRHCRAARPSRHRHPPEQVGDPGGDGSSRRASPIAAAIEPVGVGRVVIVVRSLLHRSGGETARRSGVPHT